MRKSFAFLVFTLIIAACTTVVDFDIPQNKPKVVVNALFSPDSVWRIQISRSNSILDNRLGSFFDPVGDAVVTILDQNNQFVESITGFSDKYFRYSYKGKTKPLPGQSYTIQVDVKDEPNIKALNKVPTLAPITSVEIDSSRFISDREPIEMDITFKDPGGEKNYYTVKVIGDSYYIPNKDTVWVTREIYVVLVDPSLNEEFKESDRFINDNLFNGKNYNLHLKLFSQPYWGPQSPVTVHARVILVSISEEYYKYFTTKNLQDYTNGDPFAQPVQVFSNVENGLGIFAGYSSSVVELK